jgi:hypothetical protein
MRLRDSAGKHKQSEAEDAAEDAATPRDSVSDTASPDAAANGAEPEPEAEEEAAAVEQLAVALFDFPPEEADDLGFVKGDIITVLQTDDDWWEGKLQNGDGCVASLVLLCASCLCLCLRNPHRSALGGAVEHGCQRAFVCSLAFARAHAALRCVL